MRRKLWLFFQTKPSHDESYISSGLQYNFTTALYSTVASPTRRSVTHMSCSRGEERRGGAFMLEFHKLPIHYVMTKQPLLKLATCFAVVCIKSRKFAWLTFTWLQHRRHSPTPVFEGKFGSNPNRKQSCCNLAGWPFLKVTREPVQQAQKVWGWWNKTVNVSNW